jgi:hypothetical protein
MSAVDSDASYREILDCQLSLMSRVVGPPARAGESGRLWRWSGSLCGSPQAVTRTLNCESSVPDHNREHPRGLYLRPAQCQPLV